ncbi:hypothetical protein BDZ85DRAFT_317997 [Elsinoe ampelina]|uniref:Uncharacterized protein n=1 Tax=Elsinoe ampelina TaxID=302913 RepID=A0A6A6GED6_9PEZI|nr:hypothetical protein BDZ85DRAFT_317997 [Elsinoe ampelina]
MALSTTFSSSFATSTITPSIPIITPRADSISILRFTPAAGCFTDLNFWAAQASCSSPNEDRSRLCNYFHLADPWYGRIQPAPSVILPQCYLPATAIAPATECPIYYTPASTSDITVGLSRTSRTVICCPTLFPFTYTLATTTAFNGNVATFSTSTCYAPSPTISLFNPFIPFIEQHSEVPLLATSWSSTTSGFFVPSLVTTTFTTASDVLLAFMVSISFEVSKGRTCAPNCASPFTGGEWPLPTTEVGPTATVTLIPTRGEEESGCWSSSLCEFCKVIVVAVTVPVGLTLLCCVGCCWCFAGRRKERRREREGEREVEGRRWEHGGESVGVEEGKRHVGLAPAPGLRDEPEMEPSSPGEVLGDDQRTGGGEGVSQSR